MEIVFTIAGKIVEYAIEPVRQWLCYSFHYSSNIESMKKKVKELRDVRKTVQHSVRAAERNGEEIEELVTNWLINVDKKIEEASKVLVLLGGEEIEDDVQKSLTNVDENTEEARKVLGGEEGAKRKCSNAACLNLKQRHQLSHKAAKIVEDIGGVLKNRSFDTISYRPDPQGIVTTSTGSMEYVDFDSRKSIVKGIMEALKDDNIHVIGVWGMPGVGKNTLVREVANRAKKGKLFDGVAIVNVTQSPDLRRIQGEIADALGLKFDEENVPGRASRLLERLTKTKDNKKMFLILDGIWEDLNLEKIGIPSKGCKILLTSSNREVLFCGMDTQKYFGLEVLPEEEAWSLFEKMAGDCVKDPILRCKATEVAKECAGLPLALVTVSRALKNKELFEWNDALQRLRRPVTDYFEGKDSKIYSSIKLSYEHLKSDQLVQGVFLFCAQLRYYINERDLLKYCYGLDLFHGINTLEDARNRLNKILRILKDCCLLLDSPSSSKHLRMHDVVRDVATLIASNDHNMFVVRADGGRTKWPDADKLKRCMAFSILGGDIHELPNEMECPELRFLFVYCNDRPLQISNTFFEGMRKLKVLDMSKMRLPSLPSSLHHLKNLQTLCLDQCVLGDIAVIGGLKNLEVLSLLKSRISQLPREIGSLTRLRLLDLSDCSKLEVIPPNVLSSLIALEDLYMGNSFVKWEAKGLNNERNNASLAELKHLSHLITLEIHIPDASNLPKDLLFEDLERYIIYVGDVWDWSDRREEASRTLKLKLNTSFHSEVGIKKLLKRAEKLYLDELKGVKSVLQELDGEGFQQLKHLRIQNNPEMKYIINSWMSVTAFPALETFLLKNMASLEEICHGQLRLTSFGNLRVVKVECCDNLKFVFSSSIARVLSQLEELEIRKCRIMGAIVMKEEGEIEEEDTSLFPQLRRLALKDLPKPMSFLSTQNSLGADAGEIISEGKLDFRMEILHGQVVFPKLEMLELSSIGLEDIKHDQHRATRASRKLENMQSMSRFQNLSHLEVQCSDDIKYLLSFSTAKFMEQLKYLHILECEVMEEIIVNEYSGVVEENIPNVLFPRLEVLILEKLPILKRFCEGSNIKFPSLKELSIDHCPKLKTFISKPVIFGMTTSKELKETNAEESPYSAVQPLFNEEVAFPSLEYLEISNMDDLKILWQNQFAVDSFYKLQEIEVESCKNLVNIFESDMLTRFQSLEELNVSDCVSLQEVFDLEGLNVTETHDATAIQLKELYLDELPNMRHVWSKDPKPIFSFQNLEIVHALGCRSLKSLFPASVATCLTQLEQLVIVNCGVEEIVAGEEAAQPIARFVFPQLTVLHLAVLPRLKWFYPGVHASEWPKLKDMLVAWCRKVEIFASELLSFEYMLRESQLEIPINQPLFLVDQVPFPSLENLRIAFMLDLKIIWHHQFTADSFCKPQIIKAHEFCENLIVQETSAVTATQLQELYLSHLPKLKHLWNNDPQEIFSFQNPLEVHAMGCESMEIPFPVDEEDFSSIPEVELDDDGVKKIALRGPNSMECILELVKVHNSEDEDHNSEDKDDEDHNSEDKDHNSDSEDEDHNSYSEDEDYNSEDEDHS